MRGPGPEREIEPGKIVFEHQLRDAGQSLARPQPTQLEILGYDFGKLVLPVVQQPLDQIIPVLEMPVEAALGDPEVSRQALDPYSLDAFAPEYRKSGLDPRGLAGSLSLHGVSPSLELQASVNRQSRLVAV